MQRLAVAPADNKERVVPTRSSSFRRFVPYLYLLPALLFLLVFLYYPLGRSAWISFFDWNLISPRQTYVGLANYHDLLTDASFWSLVWQTILYMLLSILGTFLLPAGLALLTLQIQGREVELYQALLFVPTVVASSVGALLWLWIYLPVGGLLNSALLALHLHNIPWLDSPSTALPAIAVVAAWKVLGFNYLIALAGLKAIPTEYLEAARVDGATGWLLISRIIVPLFAPSAVFLLVTSVLQALPNVLVPIQVLTLGGPANATNNLFYAVYQEGFEFFRAGRAGADAVLLILLFSGIAIWQFRIMDRAVNYDR
ncbi:MAG: sugar ABC transporter permease [Ktedonobacteraceae bacterium]